MRLTKLVVFTKDTLHYSFAYACERLIYVLSDEGSVASEAIYLARLSRLNHVARNAFIECANGIQGFINLPARVNLQEGALLPVELGWGGDAHKQAKFRYSWRLVGKYVVYQGSAASSVRLPKASELVAADLSELLVDYPGIWAVRSCVRSRNDLAQLAAEMAALSLQAAELNCMSVAGIYFNGTPNYLKLLRSLELAENCQVLCNSPEVFEQIRAKVDLWQIDSLTLDPRLDCQPEITAQQQREQSAVVRLANGASLEVYTVGGINLIDVNAANLFIEHERLNFILLDAIHEQICLRNLQGIILLDLLKNLTAAAQAKICRHLSKCFANDVTETKVLGFSNAGLCELIRTKF